MRSTSTVLAALDQRIAVRYQMTGTTLRTASLHAPPPPDRPDGDLFSGDVIGQTHEGARQTRTISNVAIAALIAPTPVTARNHISPSR